MASSNVYQSKLKRLVFENEATTGTADTLDADSVYVPAFDISLSRDRGEQIIARDGVMDGYAGEMCGVPGSQGSSLSFSCEIHPVNDEPGPYFVRLLQGCGWEGSDSGTAVTLTPSTAVIVDADGGFDPNSLTFGYVQRNTGIEDTLQSMFGSTGAASLVLSSGQRAQMDFSFVGLQDGFITTGGEYGAYGDNTVTDVGCSPFVVKGITASLVDSGGEDLDVVEFADLSFNSNAETPDVLDPTAAAGFGVSPVFFNTAPTVSFTIAATENNNNVFFQNFAAGSTIAITATLEDSATGNTISLVLSQVQFTGVTMGDKNGFESYSIEGKVVREPGSNYDDAGSLCQIVWTYDT